MHLSSFSIVLVLAGATTAGCAVADDHLEENQAGIATSSLSSFVLTVSGELPITVSSPGVGNNRCLGSEICNFAYIGGSQLTIKSPGMNVVDCVLFLRWNGACAGQGNQCNLVINSNISTNSVFGSIIDCDPR